MAVSRFRAFLSPAAGNASRWAVEPLTKRRKNMYPLGIPGITGESIKKFMFNKDANEQTMVQLVNEIPPQTELVFYDKDYPSPSDPGAFVSFRRFNDQYIMQRSNHGWSNKWETITVESLAGYLSQCSNYNMGPDSPNTMFSYPSAKPPSPKEIAKTPEPQDTSGLTLWIWVGLGLLVFILCAVILYFQL